MKKKQNAKKKKQRIDLSGWFSPVTQAKYWAGLIGRIVRTTGKGNATVCHISFEYARDGRKLPKPEQFTFPLNRLKPVTDFSARVKKHLPATKPASAYDDLAVIEAEEV